MILPSLRHATVELQKVTSDRMVQQIIVSLKVIIPGSSVLIALIPCLLFGTWNIGYQYYTALNESFTFLSAILIIWQKWLCDGRSTDCVMADQLTV